MNAAILLGNFRSEHDQTLSEEMYDLLHDSGHVAHLLDHVNMSRPGEVRDVVAELAHVDLWVVVATSRKLQGVDQLKSQEVRKVLDATGLAVATLARELANQGAAGTLVVLMPTPPELQTDMVPWVMAQAATEALVDCVPHAEGLWPAWDDTFAAMADYLVRSGWTPVRPVCGGTS